MGAKNDRVAAPSAANVAAIAPENAITEPTLRSMLPPMMMNVIPIATIASTARVLQHDAEIAQGQEAVGRKNAEHDDHRDEREIRNVSRPENVAKLLGGH